MTETLHYCKAQPWYTEARNSGSLYSELFEMYEKKERGRQLYIEQMIEGKKPSFGYVVLANLMARNYINTVLTTNFDDLVYNACSTFTDIRPVVYAYGSMVSDLRITNTRPKILKLHGDYLYSKLKNSANELASQDPNMSRHVSALLNEYGLVVMGYSGCDASVMDMLRNFPPNNDLYWCGRAGSPLPESVRSLLVETDGAYVEIESFDQIMNEIRNIVGFDVPKMLGSLEARQDQIIERLKTFPRTLNGLGALMLEIWKFRQNDTAERQQKGQKDEAFLRYVNAFVAWQDFDFSKAESEFRASLQLNPVDVNASIGLSGVLCQKGKYTEAEAEVAKARPNATGQMLVDVIFQLAYVHMVQGRYVNAVADYLEVIRLSPQLAAAYNGAGVAYLGMGSLPEAATALQRSAELNPLIYYPAFNLAILLADKGEPAESLKAWTKANELWQFSDHIDRYNHAVILASLGRTGEAIEEMKLAIERGQPGLAQLALESVRLIPSSAETPPGIATLRAMLEKAVAV